MDAPLAAETMRRHGCRARDATGRFRHDQLTAWREVEPERRHSARLRRHRIVCTASSIDEEEVELVRHLAGYREGIAVWREADLNQAGGAGQRFRRARDRVQSAVVADPEAGDIGDFAGVERVEQPVVHRQAHWLRPAGGYARCDLRRAVAERKGRDLVAPRVDREEPVARSPFMGNLHCEGRRRSSTQR